MDMKEASAMTEASGLTDERGGLERPSAQPSSVTLGTADGRETRPSSRKTTDLAQGAGVEPADPMGVQKSDDQDQSGKTSHSRPPRLAEARKAAEEYVEDLRGIVRKLGARLLN